MEWFAVCLLISLLLVAGQELFYSSRTAARWARELAQAREYFATATEPPGDELVTTPQSQPDKAPTSAESDAHEALVEATTSLVDVLQVNWPDYTFGEVADALAPFIGWALYHKVPASKVHRVCALLCRSGLHKESTVIYIQTAIRNKPPDSWLTAIESEGPSLP